MSTGPAPPPASHDPASSEGAAPTGGTVSEARTQEVSAAARPLVEGPDQPSCGPLRGLLRDLSLPAVLAGCVSVIVAYAGTLAIMLQAASAGHLTQAETSSWIWAVSFGGGVTCIGLSLWTRQPVITAWSTPAAALLVTSLGHYSYPEAIGAFIVSGVLTTVIGFTGAFGRLIRKVPPAVVSAMLAGILFSFGTGVFTSLRTAPWIAAPVLVAYLAGSRWLPRYATLLALGVGVSCAAATSRIHIQLHGLELAHPVFTAPHFSLAATVGLAIPMTVATLGSQNAPGLAMLSADGFVPRDRLLIGTTGVVSTVLAPLGSHSVSLAAITAGICTGPGAHPDRRRRYVAGLSAGVSYLVLGSLGSALVLFFSGLPKELVAAVAGVALFGALAGGLTGTVSEPKDRQAALVTFLATASGVTLFSIGAAFWGLLFGVATHLLLSVRRGTG